MSRCSCPPRRRTLADDDQEICGTARAPRRGRGRIVNARRYRRATWRTIEIDGHWKHAIDVGIDLPGGGSYTTSYAPIPPGSSTGSYALANVNVFPAGIAAGTYTLSLWATDGTIRDAVPVTLVVQDSCVGY